MYSAVGLMRLPMSNAMTLLQLYLPFIRSGTYMYMRSPWTQQSRMTGVMPTKPEGLDGM